MANNYSQITIQAIFAVKYREHFILKNWRDRLHQYIAGTIDSKGGKTLAVGGWKDHVHALFGMPVITSIAYFIGTLKSNSSRWVNDQNFVKGHFEWQKGYGAFSYSKDQRDVLIKYIMNQETHHQGISFKEEFISLLNDFEIEFDSKYLFKFFD